MRILHLSNYYPYTHRLWGGAEMACKNIIEALAATGSITQGLGVTTPQRPVEGPFISYAIPTIPELYPAPYFAPLRHAWLQKDHRVKRRVGEIVEEFKPDCVHFHNFEALTFSALEAVRAAKIPAVCSVYDYWLFCPTDMLINRNNRICTKGQGFHCLNECLRPRLHRLSHHLGHLPLVTRKTYFNRGLARFDRMIALSRNSGEVIRRHGPGAIKVEVAPLPITIPPATQKVEPYAAPTLLFAGWVQERKGAHLVVAAMERVVKELPMARLKVVGPLHESTYEARLRAMIGAAGLENNVELCGKLPRDEFASVFARADGVVVAEQWENMSPVFVLESMAAGKGIVSGRIGGIPELIRDGVDGLLADPHDPNDFADKIVSLLRQAELRERLGQSARRRVREMNDPGHIATTLRKLYESVMEGAHV